MLPFLVVLFTKGHSLSSHIGKVDFDYIALVFLLIIVFFQPDKIRGVMMLMTMITVTVNSCNR
jgi:hypothetical protein